MDLISKEAARKAVISMADAAREVVSQSHPGREWFDIGIATAVTAMENTPDGWISVKERLPDTFGLYLAYYAIGENRAICILEFWPSSQIWAVINGETIKKGRVTHWMELPSPPAE